MSDRPLSLFSRVKAFFGFIGMVGMGVLILFGPEEFVEEMNEEIGVTWRMIAGVGFLVFGGAFGVTAWFMCSTDKTSKAMASRFRGLLVALICSVILLGYWFTFGREVYHAWRLQSEGRATTAVVVRKDFATGTRGVHYRYTIRYDGHTAKMRLKGSPEPGTRMPVLYLPSDPAVMLPGDEGDGFLAILDRKRGLWPSLGFTAVGLLLLLGLLYGLKRFVFGKSKAALEAEGAGQ